jgi:hypothetical protein
MTLDSLSAISLVYPEPLAPSTFTGISLALKAMPVNPKK